MVSLLDVHGNNLTEEEKSERKRAEFQNGRVQHINFAEDDQMEIQGFIFSKLKANLCTGFYVITLGFLRLLFHWYPVLHLKATHTKCDLKIAEKLLILDDYKGKTKTHFVEEVLTLNSESFEPGTKKLLKFRLVNGETKELYQIRIIRCKKLTYVWDDDRGTFIKLAGLENGISHWSLHEFKGQSKEEQNRKRIVYGNNEILTPEQTIMTLFVLEALTPFYVFQLFSLVVWSIEMYYYYAVGIVIMSVVGISMSIIQTRKNQRKLKGTVNFTSTVTVCRGDGVYEEISTTCLVPGDAIVIPKFGCEMYCDAVLLSGSCIVNESVLTGESVPVTKTPLGHHDTPYSVKEDVNHTLFCGTKVLQTRTHGQQKVIAVVIRTGFLTTKGELVRSILYPPPVDFKFETDSYKYIGILAAIAVLGFIYTVVSKLSGQESALEIAVKALDIITIVIPPALPATMTVGKLYAINRLKWSKIFCINSRVINVSGSVDCICFDKTGTLTEDAMDMWGVVPVENKTIKPPTKNVRELRGDSKLFRGITVCHSLTNVNGEVVGDPLDVKMFESTKWEFVDNHVEGKSYGDFNPETIVRPPQENANEIITEELGIAKQFQFSSALQRMSVIAKSPGSTPFEVFCKGSPEKIISLSNKNTVPNNIYEHLNEYTAQGYRVIGLASKVLDEAATYQDIAKFHRDQVENDLEFLGLLIFENRLKPETKSVIRTLKDALFKVVMITGDNVQTAITVARECEIIDQNCIIIEVLTEKPTKDEFASINYHVLNNPDNVTGLNDANGYTRDIERMGEPFKNYCFVISGQSWANVVKYFPDVAPRIVTKGAVFARMSGFQKQQLVEHLKNLSYYVAMCGDGANDCGALKAAHVGISLSDAESSIASPFTSKDPNISCAPKVIKEGRAALVTSFGVFKMMLCYSLTEFASVIILYGIATNLSSLEFLFIDACLILNFAATFGRTEACEKLAKKPPRTSILSFIPLSSMALFMLVAVASQTLSYLYIQTYDWFEPFKYVPNYADLTSFTPSYENYAVYCTSMFQYITMTIVFSKGTPYRKNMFTNKIFVFSLAVMTLICIYITLYPNQWLADFLQLRIPPQMDGRLMCIWVALVTFVACCLTEYFLVEVVLEKATELLTMKFSKKRKQYLEILKDLQNDPLWPPTDPECMKVIRINEIAAKSGGVENASFVASEINLDFIRG